MLNILEETKEQYRADSVHKEIEIRIPGANITLRNEDLVSQSVSLKESIESSDNLSFTGCIASVFKFSCVNLIPTIKNEYIEADITANDTTETIPLFRGYIDEVTNPSHEETTTTITCYDILYKSNNTDVRAWYDSLTFPITIRNFRNSLCSYLGITQIDDYLPNDSLAIQKTIDDKSISGTQLLKYICQINGRFGQIGRDGKFVYRHLVEGTEALYPREDLFPANDIYPADENALESINKAHYKTVQFEAYTVNPITKVQLVNKEGVITATAGSGTNALTVHNNPLIYGLTTANLRSLASNLYNTVQGLWYVPAKVKSIGLPYVECGDFVLVAAKHSIVRHYVLTRTLTGIQSLTDVYEAEGDLDQPIYKPNIEQKVSANSQAIQTETANRVTAISNEANARATAINNEATARTNAINGERQARIDADNVNARNITATSARIDTLRSDVISANQIFAQQIGSQSNRIDSVYAVAIDAKNIAAGKVDANYVNTKMLDAYNASIQYVNSHMISTDVIDARFGVMARNYSGTMRCGELYVANQSAPWTQVSIFNGSQWHTYNFLGRRVQ